MQRHSVAASPMHHVTLETYKNDKQSNGIIGIRECKNRIIEFAEKGLECRLRIALPTPETIY